MMLLSESGTSRGNVCAICRRRARWAFRVLGSVTLAAFPPTRHGSMAITEMLELDELCLQICRRQERVVEELAPNRADQALHEGVRKRGIRNRFDFHHVQDSKIGVPLMESVQRIMAELR